ncbi:MAG: hypothetical protein I3273_04990 [Candidatus Moeniiplasma glomeromycotorum]|nr:hypothetical protein [Candidatus Moeniiplasma glomeromycotorum]MCE8167898.1 hypothetical protein [Candidatus Moeniiplasma glomeromycotorum]MCE8169448.1 hypothetical protein [Candidatus Moeniiplasma glomeromycotorum]
MKNLCCQFQELILECLYTENFQEYWKSMECWIRTGKSDKVGEITFNCSNCSEFYGWIIKNTGMNTNSQAENINKIKEIGCCQSIGIIRDLEDKVAKERVKVWLEIFKGDLCGECEEKVKNMVLESFLEEK